MKKVLVTVCLIFAVIIAGFTFSQTNAPDDTAETTEKASYGDPDAEFPVITKAVLYRDGVPEEIEVSDERIVNSVDYIMKSIREGTYGWLQGVLSKDAIEGFYTPDNGLYLMLDIEKGSSEKFGRYDKALISLDCVTFIETGSVSYLGGDNPHNENITPYFEDRDSSGNRPDILEKFFDV